MTVEEILALLENRPKLESIDVECSRTLAVYEHWFQIFKPKLEELLEDYVSRAQIQKLIEDFRDYINFIDKARSHAPSIEMKIKYEVYKEVLGRLEAVTKEV